MLSVIQPLTLVLFFLPLFHAAYTGPLQPEISNGTFHHFFLPDGEYDETVDPEQCQMLFKWLDRSPCLAEEERDSVIRDDFITVKQQVEDSARVLESIGRSISYDLEGEDTYGKYLRREIEQITEAFSSVEKSLGELEVKFKQSQESEQREEQEFTRSLLNPMHGASGSLQETVAISSGLKDKHELISLIIRSHGTRFPNADFSLSGTGKSLLFRKPVWREGISCAIEQYGLLPFSRFTMWNKNQTAQCKESGSLFCLVEASGETQ